MDKKSKVEPKKEETKGKSKVPERKVGNSKFQWAKFEPP